MSPALLERVQAVLGRFTAWLDAFGETSPDHQSFYAGPIGGRAKSLYYRSRVIGTLAVAPMVLCEAFAPSTRRLWYRPPRFPIADAHYAMGHALLYEDSGDSSHLTRAIHFLKMLEQTRCGGFQEHCWGYPFDWVTRNGIIKAQTPLITTTPYVYEAFLQVLQVAETSSPPLAADQRRHWNDILHSITRHACADIKDFRTSATASSCSYTPFDGGGVVNAAAYRAFLLTSSSKLYDQSEYWSIAKRNIEFVLEAQNADGSWPYAVDGMRDFVDHFHTCFVMKALAKIHTMTGHEGCWKALCRGIDYYISHLFDTDGLPKPFAKAPRLTMYQRELYDCAECINLCLLLRDRFPRLREMADKVVEEIVTRWVTSDGSFRSRRLLIGWDNVPMHRWGQSQMFRSLAFYLNETTRKAVVEAPESALHAAQDGGA